jgi:hypothetical protein
MVIQVERDQPDALPHILNWLADIESAKTYLAEHPAPPPTLLSPLDYLYLSVIQTWVALSEDSPAPTLGRQDLHEAIYSEFRTHDGQHHVDRLCDEWLAAAREIGLAVEDDDGDLLPDVCEAITHTVSEAIWFALTEGYATMTGGRYDVPHRFLSPGYGTIF